MGVPNDDDNGNDDDDDDDGRRKEHFSGNMCVYTLVGGCPAPATLIFTSSQPAVPLGVAATPIAVSQMTTGWKGRPGCRVWPWRWNDAINRAVRRRSSEMCLVCINARHHASTPVPI